MSEHHEHCGRLRARRVGLSQQQADGFVVEVEHEVPDVRQLGIAPSEEVEPVPDEIVEVGREGDILLLAAGRVDERCPDLGVGEWTHDVLSGVVDRDGRCRMSGCRDPSGRGIRSFAV